MTAGHGKNTVSYSRKMSSLKIRKHTHTLMVLSLFKEIITVLSNVAAASFIMNDGGAGRKYGEPSPPIKSFPTQSP